MLSALILAALTAASPSPAAGRVLDPDGNPARATVRAFAVETQRAAVARQAAGRTRTPLATVETSADGTFRIAAPPQSVVEASAEGFLPDAARVADEPLTLELRRAETLAGTVKGAAGPLAGAVVAWIDDDVEMIATTGADGAFRVPARRSGQLRVFHPDFAAAQLGADTTDVTLDPGRAVSGVVTDAAGRPVAGADVFVDDFMSAGRTDAQGRFRAAHAHADWDRVTARRGTLAGTAARRSGAITVRLQPARALTGTVREETTRAPIAGVLVNAGVSGADATAVTDAQGRYAISGLAPGRYTVWAQGDGLTPSQGANAEPVDLTRSPSAQRDLVMARAPRWRGRVEDEARRPVAGARVALGFKGPQVYATEGLDVNIGSELSVRTGADGSFALPFPSSQRESALKSFGIERSLVVLKQGFAVLTAPAPSGDAPPAPVTLTLRRGTELSGRVVTADGAPLADAAVVVAESGSFGATVMPMHVLLGTVPPQNAWVRTDAAGRFATRVQAAAHDLVVHHRGYARRVLRDQRPGGEPLEVVMDPAASIVGRVVRADGRGVAGAKVTAQTEMPSGPPASAETDENGAFALPELSPGLYSLAAVHPKLGMVGQRMQEAPAREVVFTLPAAGTVRGRAVDAASQKPVTGGLAVTATSGAERGGWRREGTADEATGAFVVEDVPEGTVTLRATAEGYADAEVEDVAVAVDETAEVEIALRADAPVTGRVTDEAGAPVAAHVFGKAKDGDGSASATVDGEGLYELRGLAAGEIEVSAGARGYATEKRTADTRQNPRVDLVLKRGLALRGEVVGDGGAPVAGAGVFANGTGHQGSGFATADERGRFTVEGLTEGRYTVSARASDGRHAKVEDVEASRTAPLRIVLEKKPTGVLTGRVVGLPEDGEPLMAMVQATAEEASAMAAVDSAHRFRMTDAPAGAVTVRARALSLGGGQRTSRPVELTLAAGAEQEVVLEFSADVVISGLVTRDGVPVPFAGLSFSRDDSEGASTRADARGAYEIVGVEPGLYQVAVNATEPQASFATEYAVAGSAQFDIDIAGAAVDGRVVRADTGAPVAGVDVSLFRASDTHTAASVTTSASGTFSARSLRDGTYRVVTHKAGFGQAVREVELARGTPAAVALELEPADGLSLSVVDGRDGRALDAIVVVRDAQKRIVANRHTGLGEDGVLTIPLADGSYVLSTSATGYGTATLPVTAPGSGLKVPLTPGGTLVLTSERSLSGRVRLVRPDGEEYVRCWCNGIADIKLQGRRTTVENVTPGPYTVEVVDEALGIGPRPAVILEGQTTTVTLE